MDKQDLIARLMGGYLEEGAEHLAAWNRDLLAVESAVDAPATGELVHSLFRTAHTLKSASRAVSVGPIEVAAHWMESLLSDVRDQSRELSPELIQLLFECGDAVGAALEELRANRTLPAGALGALTERLQAVAAGAEPVDARRPVAAVKSRPIESTIARPEKGPAPQAESESSALSDVGSECDSEPKLEIEAREEVEDAKAAQAPAATSSETLRVTVEKIDTLVAHSNEVVVSMQAFDQCMGRLRGVMEESRQWISVWHHDMAFFQNQFSQRTGDDHEKARAARIIDGSGAGIESIERKFESVMADLSFQYQSLQKITGPLEDEARSLRMVSFEVACDGLERAVRDAGQTAGRRPILRIIGGDTEIDRGIAEALRGPLLHVVRNALGHGIETPSERQAQGKPKEGQVEIRASVRGAQVLIEIADDGRGVDLALLRERMRERRLPVPDDDAKLLRSIFLPGVSTSKMITDISGRGVGLDVVKTQVEKLHGSIEVTSVPGEGVTLRLSLPLTLTTVRAVLVRAGGQLWALPSNRIERVLRIAPGDVQVVEGVEVLLLDGKAIPVVPLARVLSLGEGRRFEHSKRVPVAIIGTGGRSAALTLDELVTEQEILVKGLGHRLRRLPYVAGASQISDAETVLILHVAQVLDRALELAGRTAVKDVFASPPDTRPRLVLAEDSPTTRSLETMMLEGAGYEVRATTDGVEAWEALQSDGADLLVTDVEMPRMDGFDLVKTVRASKRFAELPVILVTGLARDEHQKRGMEVGANAYIVKNAFDQTNLLETIKVLL